MVQAASRVSTPVARATQQSTRRNAFAARVLGRGRRVRLGPAPRMLAALRALETYRRAVAVAATPPQLGKTAPRVVAAAAIPRSAAHQQPRVVAAAAIQQQALVKQQPRVVAAAAIPQSAASRQ